MCEGAGVKIAVEIVVVIEFERSKARFLYAIK